MRGTKLSAAISREAARIHGKPWRGMRLTTIRFIDHCQPFWVGIRKRLQAYAADHREQCNVNSDAQRHDQKGNECESGRAAQGPNPGCEGRA